MKLKPILSVVLLFGATACPPAPAPQQEGGSGGSSGEGSGGSSSGGSNGSGTGGHGSGGTVGSGGAATGGTTATASGGNSASGGQVGSGSGGQSGSGSGGAAGAGSGGRAGSAGSSAAGGAAGGSMGAGGAPVTASCFDNVQNGNETGVDCGGSCATTCVNYKTGMPNSDQNQKNVCDNGSGSAFICPRFIMFSPEMKQAAADDAKDNSWPAGSFNYAVVTLNGAKCCDCFQIVYSTPQNGSGVPAPKAVIGQNFNQGGANNAFDVFVGKGGEGAQTNGCNHMYSTYPSTGEPSGGGIKATATSGCTGMGASLSSDACVSAVTNACEMIKANSSYVQQTTQTSCIETNLAQSLYHENWNVKAQRIECPQHLTEVTGCRLNSQSLPKADPTIQTATQASSWSAYGTTTMQDCCKPSCAWPTNVSNTQGGWSTFYQCKMDGTPMTK